MRQRVQHLIERGKQLFAGAPWSKRTRHIGGVVLLAVLVGATGVASAGDLGERGQQLDLAGAEVPGDLVGVIAQASLSCPSLTAPRLAGQIMAESGFAAGSAVAGLTDAEWEQWRPWPEARRDDPVANVTALAHQMCDLVGRIRSAGIDGEPWELALAAHHVGLPAVLTAAKVPDTATSYVATVTGYTDWYDRGFSFTTGSTAPSAPPGTSALATGKTPVPVPDEYVDLIVVASRACPQISGVKLASQLMAASAFNPTLLGTDGGQGIAQFLPDVWARYGKAGQTPWEPAAAISTLARTMCTLIEDLAGLAQDPYPAALAAYRWGAASLSRNDGAPDALAVKEYTDLVLTYAAYYVHDPRLAAPPVTPSPDIARPVRTPAPTVAPTKAASSGGRTTTPPTTAKTKPKATPSKAKTSAATSAAEQTFQIHGLAGKCVYAPAITDGRQLAISGCTSAANQRWRFPGDGTIRMGGLCMDLAGASANNGTRVQLAHCNGGWAQRFDVNGSHDMVNTAIGKCVDVTDRNDADGTGLQIWECNGGNHQKWFVRG